MGKKIDKNPKLLPFLAVFANKMPTFKKSPHYICVTISKEDTYQI